MISDVEDLIVLFKKLYFIIEGKNVNFKYTTEKFIRQIVQLLEIYKDDNSTDLKNEIKRLYRNLYPSSSGLTEFFFWDNNFEKRMELNVKLEETKKKISILMEKLFYE